MGKCEIFMTSINTNISAVKAGAMQKAANNLSDIAVVELRLEGGLIALQTMLPASLSPQKY